MRQADPTRPIGWLVRATTLASGLLSALLAVGCGGGGAGDSHTHAPGESHDHAAADSSHEHAGGDDHHSGVVIELGELSIGGHSVRASRDGDVIAGKDAPIDVGISGGPAVAAVRFWIGTEDGAGSVKAKAEIENDHWHAHVDAPSPMPTGSRLWVEIEAESGEKSVCSFDLKT